jgi:bifunctional enzyme CysN/CysC
VRYACGARPRGRIAGEHVSRTPLAVVEERDTKGLYRKARSGELANFTGIDSPYEPPEDPEIRLDTTAQFVDESVAAVLDALEARELVQPA